MNIELFCKKAKEASRRLAILDSDIKKKALLDMAKSLMKNSSAILKENARDVRGAKKDNLSNALIDRLTLNDARIDSMARSLRDIANQKDPIGMVLEEKKRPNGLIIRKVRVPIGVILIIYESRPNVTSDCAGLCVKSGNAVILRGGKESIHSNKAIFRILDRIALKYGLPEGSISIIDDPDRAVMRRLLSQHENIDLAMPRGGEGLIKYVAKHAAMPVIKHYKGVCHTYVDKSADLKMALRVCYNAKVQRPGVCNAMETLLVHKNVAAKLLPSMIALYHAAGVEIRGCDRTLRITKGIKKAAEKDWYTEYLGLILSVKVVDSVEEAIEHIMKYGSYHSDSIITGDGNAAKKFLNEVDSACVYVNASTRFTDGQEFGKGAEVGISTDKIHARGPVGVEELTSYKYLIYGNGQIRK